MNKLILILLCILPLALIGGSCSGDGGSIEKTEPGTSPPVGTSAIWLDTIGGQLFLIQSKGPWASNPSFTRYTGYVVYLRTNPAGHQWVEKDPLLRSIITPIPLTFYGYLEVRPLGSSTLPASRRS